MFFSLYYFVKKCKIVLGRIFKMAKKKEEIEELENEEEEVVEEVEEVKSSDDDEEEEYVELTTEERIVNIEKKTNLLLALVQEILILVKMNQIQVNHLKVIQHHMIYLLLKK